MSESALDRVRAICLALPDTSERLSHGTPNWFVGKRSFASYWDDHHQDGRLALWVAAPDGAQRMLCEADPEHFFVPPYVGFRGWLGVHLNRGLDWEEVAGVLETAHRTIAAKGR
jgi:hypothetical protein